MTDTTIRCSNGNDLVAQKAIDLGDGTFAVAVGVPAAAGDIPVTLAGENVVLGASEAHLGTIGGHTTVARVAITRPANTTQYAVGDAWSDSTSTPMVPSVTVARVVGGTGLLTLLTAICSAKQATLPQFTIYIFDTTFTALEDNAAVDLSDAEVARLVSVFKIAEADWKITNAAAGAGGNVVAQVAPVGMAAFVCPSGNALYVAVQLDNAYTPVSGETLTLMFSVQQD